MKEKAKKYEAETIVSLRSDYGFRKTKKIRKRTY